MRVHRTDRGFIDLDHVLAVGEPYVYVDGLYGFDVTLAFRDKPFQMLYYPADLGLTSGPNGNSDERILWQIDKDKRAPFVTAWKGETDALVG